MGWGHGEAHPEETSLCYLPWRKEQALHMAWGMLMRPKYLAPAVPINTTVDSSRDISVKITKQLPSIAMVKGWTQCRTENHIQSLLSPFSNEFGTVNLEGKTEWIMKNVCWTAVADQRLQHGKRTKKKPCLDKSEKSNQIWAVLWKSQWILFFQL